MLAGTAASAVGALEDLAAAAGYRVESSGQLPYCVTWSPSARDTEPDGTTGSERGGGLGAWWATRDGARVPGRER